jgi:hypothetical protein
MNDFDGKHTKVFQINGKNIVIRGSGYIEDMMLRYLLSMGIIMTLPD